MSSVGSWLTSARERYMQARQLIDFESLKDPETEPYKSKYEAREIIVKLLAEVQEFTKEKGAGDSNRVSPTILLLALLHYDLGCIATDVEERDAADKSLIKARDVLKDNKLIDQPEMVLYDIVILNQMGYLWSCREDHAKALNYLKEAEGRYKTWKKLADANQEAGVVIDLQGAFTEDPLQKAKDELSSSPSEATSPKSPDQSSPATGRKNLEKAHTMTLYFLAQVLELTGRQSESAAYCHSTLQRQYRSADFQPIEWAINAATLSQFFAANHDFVAARHHIACALYVRTLYKSPDNAEEDDETPKRCLADIMRIRVKYDLMLLEFSKVNLERENPPKPNPDYGKDFKPFLLNEDKVAEIEKEMIVTPALTYDDAKKIFLDGLHSIQKAKDYYTLEEHASDHVDCVEDQSRLYQHLIFFDQDLDRVCKMHKRRIDMLEAVLKEINPAVFKAQVRQITFELGEVYSLMAELKKTLFESKKAEDANHALKKINILTKKSIENFETFVDTFKDAKTNNLPTKLSEDMVRPILVAYFSIGRLYSKFLLSDPREQLKMWNEAEKWYLKFKNYIDLNPDQKDQVKEEYEMLDELLSLIPARKKQILSSVIY